MIGSNSLFAFKKLRSRSVTYVSTYEIITSERITRPAVTYATSVVAWLLPTRSYGTITYFTSCPQKPKINHNFLDLFFEINHCWNLIKAPNYSMVPKLLLRVAIHLTVSFRCNVFSKLFRTLVTTLRFYCIYCSSFKLSRFCSL